MCSLQNLILAHNEEIDDSFLRNQISTHKASIDYYLYTFIKNVF